MVELLTLFAIVFGINLIPAFGPPTWAVLVLYVLSTDIHPALLIPVAALAAASGRLLLALAFRLLGNRLPKKYRDNLTAAREALEKNRKGAILALGLFALSPVPSAQLFEAAGLAGLRLLPFTIAFFLGRTISYSIYVFTAAGLRATSLGDAFRDALTSPWGIAMQVAMLIGLVLLARLDWAKWLGGGKRKRG
ncbi:MAG TPA: VTT domain-containing protein [Allosphingosinicella sp.]|nr:VTT domain-containing protein [Allosphingosinicella sp.]